MAVLNLTQYADTLTYDNIQDALNGLDKESITNIKLNTNLTALPDNAFKDFTNVTTINETKCLLEVGNNCFENCYNLKNKLFNNLSSIGEAAFKNCKSLSILYVSSNLVELKDYTFDGCAELINIYNTNQLTSIGKYCFNDCAKFKNKLFTNSVVIGTNAFLNTMRWNADISELNISKSSGVKKRIWGDISNPTIIRYYQDDFNDMDRILDFSNSTKPTLEMKDVNNAFDEKFSDQYIPRQTECDVIIGNNITTIADNAFIGCKGIKLVDMSNVKKIGKNAFKDCIGLSSIILSKKGTDEVGIRSFSGCIALTAVENDKQIRSILDEAFEKCTALTDIDVSNATHIGVNAFKACSSLSSIDVGNIVEIGDGAFNTNNDGKYVINITK